MADGDEQRRVRLSTDLSFEAFMVALALMLASNCVARGLEDVARAIKDHDAAVRSLQGMQP